MRHPLGTIFAILVAATCGAGTTEPASQPDSPSLRVTVKTVAPEPLTGRLVAMSLREGAVLQDSAGETRRIPTRDLVRLNFSTTVLSPAPGEAKLTLVGGDVLYGRLDAGPADALTIKTVDLGRVVVPLEAVTGLDTPLADAPAYRESVEWFARKAARGQDRLLLTNGDVVAGFVNAVDSERVVIEGDMGETLIPYRIVVALRLAPAPPAPVKGPYLTLRLRSSGRLTLTGLRCSAPLVDARLRYGGEVQIEVERIVRADVLGGRWEWLGQHQPISYEHTPMLSLPWEYAPDRNVLGGPITVTGRSFAHGVGVHSRSCLTYDLKNAYGEFVTFFGMDDDSGPYADVAVAILVDGHRRFEQAQVRRGTLFGPVRLDVTGAQRIRLLVDFGENGDLQDRFNWVEAALIRSP